MEDVWIVTSWQAIQYLRSLPEKIDPKRLEAFQCKKEVEILLISFILDHRMNYSDVSLVKFQQILH